jgi:hypothetical protein
MMIIVAQLDQLLLNLFSFFPPKSSLASIYIYLYVCISMYEYMCMHVYVHVCMHGLLGHGFNSQSCIHTSASVEQ